MTKNAMMETLVKSMQASRSSVRSTGKCRCGQAEGCDDAGNFSNGFPGHTCKMLEAKQEPPHLVSLPLLKSANAFVLTMCKLLFVLFHVPLRVPSHPYMFGSP